MSTPKPIKKNNNQPQQSSPGDTQSRNFGKSTMLNPVLDTKDKPYGLVPLPNQGVDRKRPVGQDQFKKNLISGKLHLTLTVQTSTFVASGIMAMGRDMGLKVDLIKAAVQQGNTLIIPGSSLKGVVRSSYEALTHSCLCKTKARKESSPKGYSECKVKKDQLDVCPACRVFGAMGWQGLISFSDAVGQAISMDVEFMPNLYGPKSNNPMYDNGGKVAGRKFYYHAIEAVTSKKMPDGKDNKGVNAQKAKQGYVFKTTVQFKNLSEAELGTLFVILGQDKDHPMALKVGGGKPIGMGSLVVTVEALDKNTDPKERYTEYVLPESDQLIDKALIDYMKSTIAKAHKNLINSYQLEELTRILVWPTKYTAPEGMY